MATSNNAINSLTAVIARSSGDSLLVETRMTPILRTIHFQRRPRDQLC